MGCAGEKPRRAYDVTEILAVFEDLPGVHREPYAATPAAGPRRPDRRPGGQFSRSGLAILDRNPGSAAGLAAKNLRGPQAFRRLGHQEPAFL